MSDISRGFAAKLLCLCLGVVLVLTACASSPGVWKVYPQRQGAITSLHIKKGENHGPFTIMRGTMTFFSPVIADSGRQVAYISGDLADFKLWFQEVNRSKAGEPIMVDRYSSRPASLDFDNISQQLIIDKGLASEQQYSVKRLVIRSRQVN